MNRFAIFHKITGTLIAQGVSAGEPGYNPATATCFWLGEGHEVHGNLCLVGGELTPREQWGEAPASFTASPVTGLPALAHVRIDGDGGTEFTRAYFMSDSNGELALDLPPGNYRLTLEGIWKGAFGHLVLT